MIQKREILAIARQTSLTPHVVEKDYVLGWVLAGIYAPAEGIDVLSYDYIEAFAEKLRALAERTRPRDLYDVVQLYRNTEARPDSEYFMHVLRAKCEFKDINIPSLADLEARRAELEAGWIHMLQHQLPARVPATAFWDALPEVFNWLRGEVERPLLAMPIGVGHTLIHERIIDPPVGIRKLSIIELIRFAAANRLLVEIDWRDDQGNRSMHTVESYSLHRSQDGDILLTAARTDNGELRSYSIDSIHTVEPTQTSFTPRYPIKVFPSGP